MPEDTRLPLASSDPAADLVAQLRTAAPQVFSEGRIDFEKLRAALGGSVDSGPERYGLSWAGKSDAFRNVQAPSVGTLLPMPDESVDWDNTENLIIEGDNLEVLKLLQKSYHGKVKMIYIDPPYNTGNDFVYRDDYRQGLEQYLRYSGQITEEGTKQSTNTDTSGRFHSDWLSMMYPRLFLARNLLREDGVIFVSIDDNEMHNLRMLMNEVFGEENFIAQLIWEKTRKNDARFFSVGHDYMIVYARNESHLRAIDTYWREEKPGAKEIHEEYLKLRKLHGSDNNAVQSGIREFYKTLPKSHPAKKHSRYGNVDNNGVWRDDNMSWPGGGGPTYAVPHPTTGLPCAVPDGGWRYSTKEKMLEMIEKGVVVFRKDHTEPPIRKTYLLRSVGEDDEPSSANSEDEQDIGIQVQGSVFYKSAQPSSKLLAELFGKKIFDNPKDHEVLGRMIRYCCDSDSLILDFFAGSGTTGHAVLDINRTDGGNRKFILVQLPEKTNFEEYPTISQITRERVRRTIAKLNKEDNGKSGVENNNKFSRGFRALQLSSSNFKIWDAEKTPDDAGKLAEQLKLYADNVERKRTQQDVLYELILKGGLPLSSKVGKINVAGTPVWSVNDNKYLILLKNKVTREVLRGMLALKPQQVLCLDAAFDGDDALKTNTVLEAKSQGVAFHTV